MKRRVRESISGFSDVDVKEYTQKYVDDHPDLPKLVAFKVVASELNADYSATLTPGDVKLAYEGQPVPSDEPFVASQPEDADYEGTLFSDEDYEEDDYEDLDESVVLYDEKRDRVYSNRGRVWSTRSGRNLREAKRAAGPSYRPYYAEIEYRETPYSEYKKTVKKLIKPIGAK